MNKKDSLPSPPVAEVQCTLTLNLEPITLLRDDSCSALEGLGTHNATRLETRAQEDDLCPSRCACIDEAASTPTTARHARRAASACACAAHGCVQRIKGGQCPVVVEVVCFAQAETLWLSLLSRLRVAIRLHVAVGCRAPEGGGARLGVGLVLGVRG